MNKSLITLIVSGLLAANAQAAGQDNTWYGGAKLGWSNFYGVDHNDTIRDNFNIFLSEVSIKRSSVLCSS